MERDYYIFGLIIGDSAIFTKSNRNFIFFSNTNEEISLLVKEYCENKGYKYSYFVRTHEDKNWSNLYILEIYSDDFIEQLKFLKLIDNEGIYHLIKNPHFIRGFFETSATIFEFRDKKVRRHRIAFSGTSEILEELKFILKDICIMTPIVRRKEREHLGIISKSYRFSIHRRESKKNLLRWLYPDNCYGSTLYKEKISYYFTSSMKNPVNISLEYNNYRNATKAMCKHLELLAEGIRGGSNGGQGSKPIYIRNRLNDVVEIVYGWEEAYECVSLIFKNKTGKEAPIINFNKKRSKY